MTTTIENHAIVSRDRWIAERKKLLAREKELTHLRDEIARERRALPWMRVEKNYVFDTPEGQRTLAELFEGRRQLLVQHFMFGHEVRRMSTRAAECLRECSPGLPPRPRCARSRRGPRAWPRRQSAIARRAAGIRSSTRTATRGA